MEKLGINSMWISRNGDIETVIECSLCGRKKIVKKARRIFRKYCITLTVHLNN